MNQNETFRAGMKDGVKPAEKEDLSRWENEGGQPAPARNVGAADSANAKDFFQRTLDRLFQGGQVNVDQLRGRLEKEVRERPMMSLGIATAVGFALAGGFRTRAGRKMVKRAMRYGLNF